MEGLTVLSPDRRSVERYNIVKRAYEIELSLTLRDQPEDRSQVEGARLAADIWEAAEISSKRGPDGPPRADRFRSGRMAS